MTTTPTIAAEREDPMPAAALGMWLFLAGEAMFFAGLLSAFIVLQSVPGERALFVRSARVVSLPLTIVSIGILATSAVVVWKRRNAWYVVGLATAFVLVQGLACERLMTRRTIVTGGTIFDGRWTLTGHFEGTRTPLPPTFDLARTLPSDLGGPGGTYDVYLGDELADAGYGPSRNNYFACYFLVTMAHAVHVVGGMVAVAWLALGRRRGTVPPPPRAARVVALYWQFVNGVGILSLVLLALG